MDQGLSQARIIRYLEGLLYDLSLLDYLYATTFQLIAH